MTPTAPSDLTDVLALLERSGLPISDLVGADPADFRVIEREGTLAGCVAVETHGTHGLLRSLAVDASARGTGLGQRLVGAAEALARERELASLVLLTETAETFFERLGYARIDRDTAPSAIQQSSEFSSVCCCTSAVAMGKILSPVRPHAPTTRPVR
ncbi:MAG: arsenic resistance N-acetyltransferase ArsN2 [Bacteroidota bacterium]